MPENDQFDTAFELATMSARVAPLRFAVVRVDHDGVLHVRQLVVGVLGVRHQTLKPDDGLDADAVDTVNDGVAVHGESRDGVGRGHAGAAERADGDAVAAAAVVVAEDGVGARLHGEAVVLVVDFVARDGNAVVAAQVEPSVFLARPLPALASSVRPLMVVCLELRILNVRYGMFLSVKQDTVEPVTACMRKKTGRVTD
ncbi:unnamed protein product [Phytophthora lilii]|uniref:Unnamed protein product n=1 Tax=Phytophthora lilii TaxID=2077276 RepID=A0A9W6X986_9STRA|nr:unnamed protein product [Phytophthora lilii]